MPTAQSRDESLFVNSESAAELKALIVALNGSFVGEIVLKFGSTPSEAF
jgi:hypothetical protein